MNPQLITAPKVNNDYLKLLKSNQELRKAMTANSFLKNGNWELAASVLGREPTAEEKSEALSKVSEKNILGQYKRGPDEGKIVKTLVKLFEPKDPEHPEDPGTIVRRLLAPAQAPLALPAVPAVPAQMALPDPERPEDPGTIVQRLLAPTQEPVVEEEKNDEPDNDNASEPRNLQEEFDDNDKILDDDEIFKKSQVLQSPKPKASEKQVLDEMGSVFATKNIPKIAQFISKIPIKKDRTAINNALRKNTAENFPNLELPKATESLENVIHKIQASIVTGGKHSTKTVVQNLVDNHLKDYEKKLKKAQEQKKGRGLADVLVPIGKHYHNPQKLASGIMSLYRLQQGKFKKLLKDFPVSDKIVQEITVGPQRGLTKQQEEWLESFRHLVGLPAAIRQEESLPGLHRSTKDLRNRIMIHIGELNAGNDNPKVLSELKRDLKLALQKKVISKDYYSSVLEEYTQ